MAREILFKAKRKDNGEWVEGGSLITFLDNGEKSFFMPQFNEKCICEHDEMTDDILSFSDCRFYKVDPETICRYTGLTDKNDNKIWENDIVCTPYLDPIFGDMINDTILKDYTWNVTFTDGCFCVENEDRIIVLRCFTNGKNVEVLGNIFDNQEILKGSRP